jgi:hypothetical protein
MALETGPGYQSSADHNPIPENASSVPEFAIWEVLVLLPQLRESAVFQRWSDRILALESPK